MSRAWAAVVGATALVVVGALGFLILSTWESTPVDEVGLHYTGGPIEGQKFVQVVPPGTGNRLYGVLDSVVKLPATQRDYVVARPTREDLLPDSTDLIEVPAEGGAEVAFEVATYFTLNTADDVVRPFYERVCRKYECTSDDGWDRMLDIILRRPIQSALRERVATYTVDELYAGEGNTSDTSVLETIQEEIATSLKEATNRVAGGAYFCGPTFDRNQPDVCPDFEFLIISATPTSEAVRNAFAENQASQTALETRQNEAEQARAVAEGEADAQIERARGEAEARRQLFQGAEPALVVDLLRAQAMQACAEREGCTLVITDGESSTDVHVNEPAG